MGIISKIRDWIKSEINKCEYYRECDFYCKDSIYCNGEAGIGCGRWRTGLIKK